MTIPDARVVAGHLAGAVNRYAREGGRLQGRYEVVARQTRGVLSVELDDAEGLTVAVFAAVVELVVPR